MKIFSATQIKECDRQTIANQGIKSTDLMERAALKCVDWIKERFQRDTLFVVLCGSGNNGGDGLAIARLLHNRHYAVKAFVLRNGELSDDCNANLTRLKNIDEELVTVIEPETFLSELPRHIVLIDAILGTGTNRPVAGWLAAFIQKINAMGNLKIAIDLPSGLMPDASPDTDTAIVQADYTLTFQFHKRAFLHQEAEKYIGTVQLLDIDLDKAYARTANTIYHYTQKDDVQALYRPRPEFAHKGTFGKALVIGGSHGKMGAVSLCTSAALRAGAGLVTAYVPACGYTIMQAQVPEAMCLVNGDAYITELPDTEEYTAVGIGPGMGTNEATERSFISFIERCRMPLVIDADGLNIIARHAELLHKLPAGSVLTPHPKEFARMFGENTNSMIQVDNARIQAMRYNVNFVLKGRYTAVISSEGECCYNSTGNPGMATGGSGDVLAGVITGLIAAGYQPFQAARLGVYLHGLAGDIAMAELGQESLIASDICRNLGKAFLRTFY